MNRRAYTTLLALTFLSTQSWALDSKVPSSVLGMTLPNTHEIEPHNGSGRILRSQAPKSERHFQEFEDQAIDQVLIFKNQTRDEVDDEIHSLNEGGYADDQVHHIPFRWKEFGSFYEACSQTIEALQVLVAAVESGETILFHCTVGEDRTGYLAGLYRLLGGADIDEVFKQEMCERGYGAGNPYKPRKSVVVPIQAELTPLFLKMAYKIRKGQISLKKLKSGTCRFDPERRQNFAASFQQERERFRCQRSSLIP